MDRNEISMRMHFQKHLAIFTAVLHLQLWLVISHNVPWIRDHLGYTWFSTFWCYISHLISLIYIMWRKYKSIFTINKNCILYGARCWFIFNHYISVNIKSGERFIAKAYMYVYLVFWCGFFWEDEISSWKLKVKCKSLIFFKYLKNTSKLKTSCAYRNKESRLRKE